MDILLNLTGSILFE